MPTMPHVPAHLIRRISVDASCDPRTVKRAIAGERIAPLTLERIARAMDRAGLPRPLAADLAPRGGKAA